MRLKNNLFLKITSFKLSESLKAAAHDQSLLEIFIPPPPTPDWDIDKVNDRSFFRCRILFFHILVLHQLAYC